ncbi:MAG: anthranilate synthase component I family protein [Angustibacter sp.]
MTNGSQPVPGPIPVRLDHQPTPLRDPFTAFTSLREHYGTYGCFLLESLAGPVSDRGQAVVGFGALAAVTVRGSSVEVDGVPALVAHLRSRLLADGVAQDRDGASDGSTLDLVGPDGFWALQRSIRDAFAVDGTRPDGYRFGAFVVYGYDAVRQIERLPHEIEHNPADGEPFPELLLLVPQASVSYDLHHGQAEITVATSPGWPRLSATEVADVLGRTDASAVPARADTPESTSAPDAAASPHDDHPPVPEPSGIVDSTTYEEYERAVRTALRHITDGDIYQVQLGHQITVESDVDQLVVYQRLRQRNPSPYMCFVDLGDTTLISASPELFLRITGDAMTMRPIAGTAPRTGDPDIDSGRVAALVADEKERAEHVMLVDLCRNDLGRVARIGTVDVDELIVVEDFSHVFHLVSNVVARKDDTADAYDAIRATFPAGTMTGAPKIRAMEIIEHLETSRRGGYAGAFGLLDVGGFVNTGLTIRSIFATGRTYRLRASAGIVADSTPAAEWRETLAKLSATYWAVTGRELLTENPLPATRTAPAPEPA